MNGTTRNGERGCINTSFFILIFFFQLSYLEIMKISSIVTETTKNAPRPLNSFMGFRLEKQREILDKYPGINHRDISKITAKWWKEMSPNEKLYYKRKAEIAKTEHYKR